jgi:aminoglycoside phosphotransferase (APT) family kinase protein
LCDDHDVLGCTFYLMERVDGVSPIPPPAALDDEKHRAEISYSMVDALASLHAVDWWLRISAGPEAFHERQTSRWSRQSASL